MNAFRVYDGSSGTAPAACSAGAERRIRLGRIDIEAKNYFSDSGRFADALNYCLYGGQPVIEPDKLSPLDTEEVIIPYGNEAREPEQRYRDLLDLWQVMADDDFRKFRTDFGQLMEYIKYSTDDEKLDQITHEGDRYRNLDVDLANLINEVTGKNLKFEVKEGKIDVCKAHEEMKRKAAEEAWEQANQRIREVEAERDEYKSELNEYKSELNEYKSELDKALRTIRMYEAR